MDLYTSVLPKHAEDEMCKFDERAELLEEESRAIMEKKSSMSPWRY